MNTIKINTLEFAIDTYGKNTYLSEGTIVSNASCSTTVADIDALNELMEDTITQIQIYHDNELIYNLQNLNAQITSINEYLNDDHMRYDINFTFNETLST